MTNLEYFHSIAEELNSLKSRVRQFIKASHWLSDGEWKESVLRSILRRHVPKRFGIGRGFVLGGGMQSTQADVLIYDSNFPLLHQDGEFVIVTTDAVRGLIEVKSHQNLSKLRDSAEKCIINAEFLNRRQGYGHCVHGLFSYDWQDFEGSANAAMSILDEIAAGSEHRRLGLVCLGQSTLIRFWPDMPPGAPPKHPKVWRTYKMPDMAPAFFINAIIEHLCPESVLPNRSLWFSENGEDQFRIAERAFTTRLPN